MSRVFVFGSNGMLGKYVYTYLKETLTDYKVSAITRAEMDITNLSYDDLRRKFLFLGLSKGDVVVNCAGMIKQRNDSPDTDFIIVNSLFPHYLARICKIHEAYNIHISTDCTYDGLDGSYDEKSKHNADDLYGKSKSLGESVEATVIRTSIIGEELNNKRSLLEWVKSNKGKSVFGFTNHTWNGVTCLQLAKIINKIIVDGLYWNGVRHIFSPKTVNKYELIKMVSDVFKLKLKITENTTTENCFRDLTSIYDEVNYFNIPDLVEQIKELKDYGILNRQ
jgi:dTDP-4-dehydrorhamnose reductase